MARQYVWWPNVDKDVENIVRNCMFCRQSARAPAAQFKSWPLSADPWYRIPLDYAGPFFGKMWLNCLDSFETPLRDHVEEARLFLTIPLMLCNKFFRSKVYPIPLRLTMVHNLFPLCLKNFVII